VTKTNAGRFFEDYRVGEVIAHAVPRTVGAGERALYHALYPERRALQSSDAFARACGLPGAPLHDLVAFHTVFGKTVPDVSLNAVANLGYAEGRFLRPVWPGDTLTSVSEVIGVKENSNGRSGVVWVRTTGRNQQGEAVLEYVRWVMVKKRDAGSAAPCRWCPRWRRWCRRSGWRCRRGSTSRATTSGLRASGTAGATTRWARRSTMWTR
jgi:2-methylfumaryl-CoA hydratase